MNNATRPKPKIKYDGRRTIHLSEAHDDSKATPSLMGYSTGHRHGNTLYVTTTKIDYDWLAIGTRPYPIPQSDETYVEETFSLSENRERLNYTMYLKYPIIMKQDLVMEKYFQFNPTEAVTPFECE